MFKTLFDKFLLWGVLFLGLQGFCYGGEEVKDLFETEVDSALKFPWRGALWKKERLPVFELIPENYHKSKRVLRILLSKEQRERFAHPALLFPVHGHPHRIYRNGDLIHTSGLTSKAKTDVAVQAHLIPIHYFTGLVDTIDVEYFAGGMHHIMPIPFLGEQWNLATNAWWRDLFYHWSMMVFISISFILFLVFLVLWLVRREEKTYFFFVLLTFSLSMAYMETVFSKPQGDALLLWKISRLGFVSASYGILMFILSVVKMQLGKKGHGALVLYFCFWFFSLVHSENIWDVEKKFQIAVDFFITPVLAMIPVLLIFGLKKRKNERIILGLLLFGGVLLISSSIADIASLERVYLPHHWWIPFGYFAFEICILCVLAVEEVTLVRGLNHARERLVEKNRELVRTQRAEVLANEAKNHFFKNVAHEIKTPMNGLRGLAEFYSQQDQSDESIKDEMLMMSDRLSVSLDNLLDIASLETGGLQKNESTFEWKSFQEQLKDVINTEADREGVKVDIQSLNVPLYLFGDRRRLSQLLCNLVWFRMKSCASGTVISVFCQWGDEGLEVTLKDQGETLSDEVRGFFRTRLAPNDLLSKKESKDFGMCGAMVLALLPVLEAKLHYMEQEAGNILFALHLRSFSEKNISSSSWQGLRVLVVEDNEMNVKIAKKILEKEGVVVTVANNGKECLETLGMENFDLILMDVQMPVMDGLEATKKIRRLENDEKSRIKILALTANNDAHECISAGMDAYLSKPLRKKDLFAAMGQTLYGKS